MLTTTQAAARIGVTASTIRRWADQGDLAFHTTPGGHRRFREADIEAALERLRGQAPFSAAGLGWRDRILHLESYALEAALLEERGRLGSWHAVANAVSAGLRAVGDAWAMGEVSLIQEHVGSARLDRALSRIRHNIPVPPGSPACVLLVVPGDEHTLGLRLAELCAAEAGWAPLWVGSRTPIDSIVELSRAKMGRILALSASAAMTDADALEALLRRVAPPCHESGTEVILGGAGAWPADETLPRHVQRPTSFGEFRRVLDSVTTP